jgi:hypothetical protein
VQTFISRRVVLASLAMLGLMPGQSFAEDRRRGRRRRPKFKRPEEPKAWIKGTCVFPFAADRVPDTADDFAAAMARGYRRALELPDDSAPVVVASGGRFPFVDSLTIDVCDAVVPDPDKKRKPSDRELKLHGVDAARLELLGKHMTVADAKDASVDLSLTATDARLLFTRDPDGKPLLMLGGAKHGRMSVETTFHDVEQLLLAAARKGGRKYGLSVDAARLRMTVEGARSVRAHLKLSTRVGFIPAGLHFRARLDIDDDLNGKLSGLSCTGDEVLGPLIGGLVQPFFDKYNGTTRPLMNFPTTDMRLRAFEITAADTIRFVADFGNTQET